MQKIIEQDLGGSEEDAKLKAQYTWQKGEIAWYFCTTHLDLFKVRFTGNHWLSGNKWGRMKIYQYEYLESSGDYVLNKKGLQEDGISHSNEDCFFTTREEALKFGYKYITNELHRAEQSFEKNIRRLTDFELQKQSEELASGQPTQIVDNNK